MAVKKTTSATTKKTSIKSKTTKQNEIEKIKKVVIDDEDEDYGDDDFVQSRTKINYISQEWYDRLVNELEDIKNSKMPWVLVRIKEAISFGDLRENSEYEAALSEKELLENRIDQLNDLLDGAVITESTSDTKNKKDRVVKYWSIVTFKIIDYDRKSTSDEEWMDKLLTKEFEVTIASSGEITSSEDVWDKVSFESPIWQALEGKKIWDNARVRTPIGIYIIEITNIK